MNCGIYVNVTAPGRVGLGDAVTRPAGADDLRPERAEG
jgi:hypothetical protein